jgi:tetratricopeptide (TPR) repeat protein
VDSAPAKTKVRIFLSYSRHDAQELADRLRVDLERIGYDVWQDTRQIRAGTQWEQEITYAIQHSHVLIALLSPYAVRVVGDPNNPDNQDSVCLDEISFARFSRHPTPIVPVMAVPCEPPFSIFRFHYEDLCGWRDAPDQYQDGLKRVLGAIEVALRGEVRYRSWVDQLKPWDFAPFLHEKRQYFCGRQWLFEEIDAWRTAGPGRALLITGDPGTGKSAIVAELVHRNPGGQVLAYHCCQASTPATVQPGLFVRSLAAMIASKLDDYAARLSEPLIQEVLSEVRCTEDPASAFEAGILAPLESLPPPQEGVRYFLIDALDEALTLRNSATTIVDLLASRLERLPDWLRLVATTRKERAVFDRLEGQCIQELDARDPRHLEDISQYINRRLESPALAGQLAASGQLAGDVHRLLREKSAGNFLYVQQALQGIERELYGFDHLNALPPGLSGLYFRFFTRTFPDEASYTMVRNVLAVVVAAQEPLTDKQLACASGLDPEDELPRVLRRLSAYLPERAGHYALYHKSIGEWLTDPYRAGMYFVNRREGHRCLANACWGEYEVGVEKMSAYALAHLPMHLVEVERWEELLTLATDPELRLINKWIEEGQGDQGLTCLIGLIHHLEKEKPRRLTAAGLATQVARIYSLRGEYDRAQAWLEYALRQTSWRHGRRERAVALHELASLHLYRNEFQQASRLYRQALRLCRWGLPLYHDEAAANLIGLATIAQANYRFPETIRLATRALRKARLAGDIHHILAGERLIAAASKSLGRYDEADLHLSAALFLCGKSEVLIERARLLLLRGWLQYERAVLEKELPLAARPAFQEAMQTAQNIHELYCILEAKMSLGWCALAEGDTAKADNLFRSLREALPRRRHPELQAGIDLGLAAVVYQSGRLEAARRLYEEVISFCRQHDIRWWLCKAMVGLGAVHWHLGSRVQAESFWKQALQVASGFAQVKQLFIETTITACQASVRATPR